jgi:hypothetical protein
MSVSESRERSGAEGPRERARQGVRGGEAPRINLPMSVSESRERSGAEGPRERARQGVRGGEAPRIK